MSSSFGGWILKNSPIPITKKPDLNDPVLREKLAKGMGHIWYVQCKPCTYLVSRLALSPNGLNKAPPNPRHLGVPSGASKTIYEPMVRLTQTEHLSCTNASTVSKLIETRFHTTHITYEFHRVRPILFLSLWYVQYKPCTNLASRVALSPNRSNRAST
jgi:hypothetical protein